MKAILEFDLPEEDHQLRLAKNAAELADILMDIDNLCSVALHLPPDEIDAQGTLAEIRDLVDQKREVLE